MAIQVRPAQDDADVLAALAVAHAAYARPEPLLAYQARRLSSRRLSRGTRWLLEADGQVVASALCHALTFARDGEVVAGYGIGSVGTLPAERRRGHGTELCRSLADAMEAAGNRIGLLYSAVPPALYERLGFRTTPAWDWRCTRLLPLAESGPAAALVPLDPWRHAERIVRAYRRTHAGGWHLHRTAESFRQRLDEHPVDGFFAVGEGDGYVRLSPEPKTLEIVEPMWDDGAEEGVLRALARLALSSGHEALSGWLPPSPVVERWFEPLGRQKTLPMLRGVRDVEPARFWSSEYF